MDQVRGSYKQLSMSSVPSNDREATTTTITATTTRTITTTTTATTIATTTIGTDIVVAVVDG